MRARLLLGFLGAFVACERGGEDTVAGPAEEAWPADGFLNLLPEGVAVTMRLPTAAAVDGRPEVFAAFLGLVGHGRNAGALFFGADEPAGIDREQAPGFARDAAGAWVHYLPAVDKGALNQALRGRVLELGMREEKQWIILSRGGKGAGRTQGEPLPRGDLALRVRHHPLLTALAQPGDTLEAGFSLGGSGLDVSGRLLPGAATATGERLARARPGPGGLLDFIPSSLAVRLETTLPAAPIAGFVTRRLARHCGLEKTEDRVVLERFCREILTGLSPEFGLAIGLEFRDGKASFVALGRIGAGVASPILAKVRRDARSSFGALVLDIRDAPKGVHGWAAWVLEPEPNLEGLPEAAWPIVAGLTGGEQAGMPVAYIEHDGWAVLAGGPRADILAQSVRNRLRGGASRSEGSFTLFHLRDRAGAGPDDSYVLGAVLVGQGFDGLVDADRAALRQLLGVGPDAQAPEVVALAGFRSGAELKLEARLRY